MSAAMPATALFEASDRAAALVGDGAGLALVAAAAGSPDCVELDGPLAFVPPNQLCPPELAPRVRLRSAGATRPLPGLDPRGALPDLPRIPSLTMDVVFEAGGSPFGVLVERIRLDRGDVVHHSTAATEGPLPDGRPTVVVRWSWHDHLLVRAGVRCPLEAVADSGSVEGDWRALLAVHGLLQDDAWLSWWHPNAPDWLVDLAAATAGPSWASLLGLAVS